MEINLIHAKVWSALIVSGVILIFVGFALLIFPPRTINSFYGYRTSRSMKTQKSWDFAQQYSARESLIFGFLLIISSSIGLFAEVHKRTETFVSLGLMVLATIILIVRTEIAIKKKCNS